MLTSPATKTAIITPQPQPQATQITHQAPMPICGCTTRQPIYTAAHRDGPKEDAVAGKLPVATCALCAAACAAVRVPRALPMPACRSTAPLPAAPASPLAGPVGALGKHAGLWEAPHLHDQVRQRNHLRHSSSNRAGTQSPHSALCRKRAEGLSGSCVCMHAAAGHYSSVSQ